MITKFECKGKLTLPYDSVPLRGRVTCDGHTEVWVNMGKDKLMMEMTFISYEEDETPAAGSSFLNHFLQPAINDVRNAFMFYTIKYAET
jgi:hypothetical protein